MAHLTKLSGVDAVTRLEEMLQWIAPEVEHAIKVEASLEAANDAFKNNFEDVPFDGSTCIRTVQHVMSLNLALTVAKIYERPSPRSGKGSKRERRIRRWEHSDIACIPLIVWLLSNPHCQQELMRRSRAWTPSFHDRADWNEDCCKRAIAGALRAHIQLHKSLSRRRSLKYVEAFRNEMLAHTRTDALFERLPRYGELFALVDAAKAIVGEAMVAVLGESGELDEIERHASEAAVTFWSPAIRAAVETNRWDRDQY